MSGNIHNLSWFPSFPEKFITWGAQEINLYEVLQKQTTSDIQVRYKTREESGDASSRFSNLSVNFLANENRYHYARCVQPSFHKDRPIIAIGLGDGKIGICNFQDALDNNLEYTPRQQRMCLCLAWNELDPNILAIGHDRHRSDSCITIWDIEHGIPKDTGNFLGLSESANSMCWDKNHRVLVAGMSQKQIKLFDFRQSNASCQSITTKAIHGLAVAPNGNYLCSYVDSVIMIWDLRAIDRPLKQISSSKNHFQLSWCPTRTSLISSLQRESPYVTLYDIRYVDVESSREVYHIKKQLLPFHTKYQSTKSHSLTALSWHPTDFERALILSETGNIIDFKIPLCILSAYNHRKKVPLILQRPPSAPATPTHSISDGKSIDLKALGAGLKFDELDRDLLNQDLADETRQRALNNYGVNNNDLLLSAYLRNVWFCLNNLYREEQLIGLKSVLGISFGHTVGEQVQSSHVESHVLQWPDSINNSSHLVCYRSEQRDRAIKLCGWTAEQDIDRFIAILCDNKEFSRAAMISVFHLKVLSACDILSKAADRSRDPSMFRIAAIALSSFSAERCSATWRNQRSTANMQIQDAHLRAIFSFLTTEKDNFDAVLMEYGISLGDRIAFACKYLPESKLADYIKQQVQISIEKGDLNGLLLTGETLDGINILQAYMDATFDVQTVTLIAINYFHREHFSDNRIQYWIASYLDYLNSWGLWEKRAELEIKIENVRASARSARSVFLSCHFCGKSVSNALQDDARMRSASSNINKLSSCPNCRKPLPRCSLCLLHMGTTLNALSNNETGKDTLGWQSKPFSKWFSWCQTCRHGGHTEHIMQWFKQNSECPVSSCSCRCFDMDATIPPNGLTGQ